jgi:hypothetical protein
MFLCAGQDRDAGLAEPSVPRYAGSGAWEQRHDLRTTLWQLYAATRVRDALLLPHQPGPVDDSIRELDEALHREQPRCRPVPVAVTTQFFAAIGCRPVTEASFDPILREIVTYSAQQVRLTADQASFIKDRCQLCTDDKPGFDYIDYGIDERTN